MVEETLKTLHREKIGWQEVEREVKEEEKEEEEEQVTQEEAM